MGIQLKKTNANLKLGAQAVRAVEEVYVGDELPTEDKGYKIWIEPGELPDRVVTKAELDEILGDFNFDVDVAPEVYVGSEVPEDCEALIWIEPDGEEDTDIVTKDYVDEAVASIDLSGYATKEEIPDTSAFQTEDDVKSLINSALEEVENGTY